MARIEVSTTPFDDQKPGTSGLRKRVTRFQTPHYFENFVQSIFDCLEGSEGQTLIVGGDGRYLNRQSCNTILRMAAANGFGRVIVGQDGILSTPAASHLIRKREAYGGLILSASHNPGGPDGDFGIKYNGNNGGPAQEALTEKIFARSRELERYFIEDEVVPTITDKGEFSYAGMIVEVVDPVADYADLMEEFFDFAAIKALFTGGFRFCFDAMHAVTGPYAREIFVSRLGAPSDSIINAVPSETFGGGHPDPNPVHAKVVYDMAMKDDGPDLCAASDGDGDRNLIIGKRCYVTPSDSLAIIAANAHLVPGYRGGLKGVARSMPTSSAVDRVADAMGIPAFETPTGWKFFGNLLDAGAISLCGEESAGTGSDHIREKDGVWAILMWLNILAVRQCSVASLMSEHWAKFGRNYHARYDYEEVDAGPAAKLFETLRARLPELIGRKMQAGIVKSAGEYTYTDPVDGSVSENQGIRIVFENGSRLVFRLSGTGTVGATLRVYLERYESVDGALAMTSTDALKPLADCAESIAQIEAFTGRTEPDAIT